MNKEEITKFITLFDEIKNQEAPKSKKPKSKEPKSKEDGIEFWFARDLQKVLDYDEWRNFNLVINKAKKSCETSKHNVEDQFVDANKMPPQEWWNTQGLRHYVPGESFEDAMKWAYSQGQQSR